MDRGITPDIAVGDFDSSAPGAQDRLRASGVQVQEFSAEKDESDLDLAVRAAREAGSDQVVFTACAAGRLDHTLAVLGTVGESADLDAELHEPELDVWTVADSMPSGRTLELPIGSTVSIFAVGDATGVTLDGFVYGLDDATLRALSSLGLSNRTQSSHVTVCVREGTLLVMSPRIV